MTRNLERAAAGAIAAAIALAGCATAPTAQRPAPPELNLLSAATLEIPHECELRGGAIYRTGYVVQPDGSVAAIARESGPTGAATQSSAPDCVEQALAGWVATFRYAPVSEPTPAVIDWMATVARR